MSRTNPEHLRTLARVSHPPIACNHCARQCRSLPAAPNQTTATPPPLAAPARSHRDACSTIVAATVKSDGDNAMPLATSPPPGSSLLSGSLQHRYAQRPADHSPGAWRLADNGSLTNGTLLGGPPATGSLSLTRRPVAHSSTAHSPAIPHSPLTLSPHQPPSPP